MGWPFPTGAPAMNSRERISHVDNAWLRMDRPENLMQILGVMIFKGRIDAERFKHTVAQRIVRYRRFRQIATQDADGSWWADDPDFDIDAHVRHSFLPAPAGKNELQKFVATMAGTPLNPSRPRWEFNLVDTADGNSALVVRIHHAIADGIALIGVINSLTDKDIDTPEDGGTVAVTPLDAVDEQESDAGDAFWRMIFDPLSDVALTSIRIGGQLWGHYLGLRNDPATIRDYLRVAGAIAEEIGRLALMPNDSPTRYKGKAGTVKRVAWSEPIPLPEIKAVGKVLGCSVNDILLASVAGALRGYLLARGDPVAATEIRAMVPVNLRAPDDIEDLGNRFGLVALELPIGIDNPLARLYATRARNGGAEGFVSGDADLHPAGSRRHGTQVHPGPDPQSAGQQDHGSDDQRPRSAAAPLFCRQQDRAGNGLGSASRRHRHGRQHSLLQRPGPVRTDHRQETGRRSRANRRPLCPRVRQAPVAVATRALGSA
jgi:diacylglycerol O-acyltransferase